MEEKKEKDVKEISGDLDLIFQSILFNGVVEKEFEVFRGFKIKLKPLETGEVLMAEAIDIANNNNMPYDIIQRARKVSILSYATVSINETTSKSTTLTEEENRKRRIAIHNHYMTLPPDTIDIMFGFYLDVVKTQNDLYKNTDEIGEKSENF